MEDGLASLSLVIWVEASISPESKEKLMIDMLYPPWVLCTAERLAAVINKALIGGAGLLCSWRQHGGNISFCKPDGLLSRPSGLCFDEYGSLYVTSVAGKGQQGRVSTSFASSCLIFADRSATIPASTCQAKAYCWQIIYLMWKDARKMQSRCGWLWRDSASYFFHGVPQDMKQL